MNTINERTSTPAKQTIVIDPNPRKEREMLDKQGNVIDPRTKQIIRKAEDNQ